MTGAASHPNPRPGKLYICGVDLVQATRDYWTKRDDARRWLNEYYSAHGYPEMVRPLPSREAL